MPSGPEHVLEYLGTHRIAISHRRLLELQDGKVSFRWRDSAHKNKQRVMAVRVEEFLRRYFLHVLPQAFVRIRHFGLFANRGRKRSLELCRRLLEEAGAPPVVATESSANATFWACPECGGMMLLIERLTPAQTMCVHRHPRRSPYEDVVYSLRLWRAPERAGPVCAHFVSAHGEASFVKSAAKISSWRFRESAGRLSRLSCLLE